MFQTAFQTDAFQNNAFQIAGGIPPPPPVESIGAGTWRILRTWRGALQVLESRAGVFSLHGKFGLKTGKLEPFARRTATLSELDGKLVKVGGITVISGKRALAVLRGIVRDDEDEEFIILRILGRSKHGTYGRDKDTT